MAILDEPQDYINESDVSPQKVIVKWTLISAAISIILSLISTMMGLTTKGFGTLMMVGFVGLVIGILIFVFAVREHRDQQLGGYISFKRVFLVVLGILLLSSIISNIFNWVYMNYINPSAVDQVVESTKEMLEKFNMPEEAIEKGVQEAEASMKSPMSIIKNTLWAAVIGAIVAAIMGAVMKKEKPKFS